MATREQIVAEARSWVGTRWHHQARVKGHGVDCLGMVTDLCEKLNLSPGFRWGDCPEYHGYGMQPDADQLLEAVHRFLIPVALTDIRKGDVGVFRFDGGPQHFAIFTQEDPLYIVHAYAQARKVVEHRFDGTWSARLVGAFRFPNTED
jgi:NlpC/P60 family putative phage cell wall peptidase